MISEVELTDDFEFNYEEYKLNEILSSQHTFIESYLPGDCASLGSSSASKSGAKYDSTSTDFSQFVKVTDDFRIIGIQIFKYSAQCIEEPKLFYTIFIKVSSV